MSLWCVHSITTNCEVSFFRSVFNDGYNQFIMVAILFPCLSSTDALYHLLVGDLELLTRVEKSGHYCSFGVSVDHSTSTYILYIVEEMSVSVRCSMP